MNEIEKVTNNQAKARSIYNSLIKDNIFYTGISKNLAIALIELGIDSSTTYKLSVEKLQEQLNTAKMALTEIAEMLNDKIHECDYSCDNFCEFEGSLNRYAVENVQSVTDSALAAIEKGENNEI